MKKLPAIPVYLALSTCVSVLFGLIFTVNLVYHATVVGLNPLQLVLVGTMLETTVFLFEVPTGIVADAYSRRLSIIIGYFIIGVGHMVEGLVPVFGGVLAGHFLWGLGFTFTSGATQAWISDEVGEEQAGKTFIRGAQAGQVGYVLAIPLSVALGSIQVNIPIYTGGFLFILLAVFLILFMPENGFRPTPREERNSWQHMGFLFRSGLKLVRQQPAVLNLLAIGLFFGLYSEGFDRLWIPHFLRDIHLPQMPELQPVVWFGFISLVGSLINIGLTEVARRRFDPDKPRVGAWILLSSSTGLVAALATFAVSQSFPLALAAFWTIGLTRGLIGPYYMAWLNRHLESGVRATVISMSSLIDALGQIVGGPVLGFIGRAISIRAALAGSALILSPVLVLLGRMILRENVHLTSKEIPSDAP